MVRFIHLLLYGLLIQWLVGCGNGVSVSQEHESLFQRTDKDSLYRAFSLWREKVSDSGTLNGIYLNQPDTLFAEFSCAEDLSRYYENILSDSVLNGLYDRLRGMEGHALDPEFYHSKYLHQCLNRLGSLGWVKCEYLPYDSFSLWLLLSADALLGMHHDLGNGRLVPTAFGSVCKLPRRQHFGLRNLLKQKNPHLQILQATPDWSAYLGLQQQWIRLKNLKDTAGFTFPVIEKSIKPGKPANRKWLRAIGRGLFQRGLCRVDDTALWQTDTFTLRQSALVKLFQQSMGLRDDGTLNDETLQALNITYSKMRDAISASLEKWRWLGPVNERNRIWVNLVANQLYAFRNDSLLLQMRTCSGTPRGPTYYRKLKESHAPDSKVLPPDNLETPQFKAETSHLVVNPTWYVPRNIFTKEMLPEIIKNPEILNKMGYVLKDSKSEVVDPFFVNWEKVSPARVPYTLEQLRGVNNSLGKVVIHFPNAYSIFLHDTPNKWAFLLSERHVSHGCVRLEKPFDLVEFLMYFNKKDRFDEVLITAGLPPRHDKGKQKKWEKEKPISDTAILKPKQDQYFYFDSMLPVYLVYITAVSTEQGGLSVYRDIYRQNAKIVSAMRRPATVRKAVLKD